MVFSFCLMVAGLKRSASSYCSQPDLSQPRSRLASGFLMVRALCPEASRKCERNGQTLWTEDRTIASHWNPILRTCFKIVNSFCFSQDVRQSVHTHGENCRDLIASLACLEFSRHQDRHVRACATYIGKIGMYMAHEKVFTKGTRSITHCTPVSLAYQLALQCYH